LVARRPAAPSAAVPAAPIPTAKPTLPRCGRRLGEPDRHGFLADLLLNRKTLRRQLLERGLAAQVEPALAVDLDRLDHDLVAVVEQLLDALYPMVGELRDVDQSVLVRQDLDESAKRHDADDLALVDVAHFDLVGEALVRVDRISSCFLVYWGVGDRAV